MAINEQIVTGRAHRVLIDKATKLWQRISYWTKGSDVEFNDAKTAETKVGAIDGITDSLVSTSSRIAASAKSVNKLNNDLAQQPEFIYDSTGKITGYKTSVGADTVFPFSSNNFILGSKNDAENNLYPTQNGLYRLVLTGDGTGVYRYLKVPVDLTNLNKIIFYNYDEINPYSGLTRYAGVAKNPPTSVSNANANVNKVGGTVNVSSDVALELDVSNLSGEYYLFWTCVSVDTRYSTRTNIIAVELK